MYSPAEASLKRPRDDFDIPADDDDDDDVSLVSRSPSPMEVDATDITKYDEYVPGYIAPEPVTVDTKIASQNKGFMMLAKLGWKEGTPLGLSSEGRVDPIPFQIKNDATGIGKITQDVRMIEETVSQRRELDSVRQQKETEEQRIIRENAVSRLNNLQSEISTTLKAFYCTLCEKQFQNVAQYDEHTNSYAHHHKARFRDMQANSRMKDKAEMDKIKEKERKREEKELRKIAAAAGIKMPKMTTSFLPPNEGPVPPSAAAEIKPSGFKKSGWASVASSSNTVIPPPLPQTAAPPPPPPVTLPPPPPPSAGPHPPHSPTFRTGGWTSLETGNSPALPPAPVPSSSPGQPAPTPQALESPVAAIATAPSSNPPQPAFTGRANWQQFQKKGSKRR